MGEGGSFYGKRRRGIMGEGGRWLMGGLGGGVGI